MANCAESVSQQAAEINMMNFKVIAERQAGLMAQGSEDNQADSRAWAALKLKTATDSQTLANRIAHNSASFDNFVQFGAALAAQIGVTEGQQTVSPEGTATSEAVKGAVGTAAAGEAVSAEAVTANVANLFTSLAPVIATALAQSLSTAVTAILPVLVTAVGGASKPSQTQPNPTA